MQPRSILKKATPANSKPVNERHLEVALHHANIIQDRKDVEEQILKATMTLMDFPSTSDADPTRPSQQDASQFQSLIIPFQPSDYDALIEERNIADKCGYTLCPRPRRKGSQAGKHRLMDTSNGVQVVDKKLLEVWCSEDCARRALYVKVQLNEEPAWLRRGGIGDKVDLLVENVEEQHKALPLRPKPKESTGIGHHDEDDENEEQAWALRDEAMAELARERGEKPDSVSKSKKALIKATIEERMSPKSPTAPSMSGATTDSHMSIEGHIPKATKKTHEEEQDDEDDKDWDD